MPDLHEAAQGDHRVSRTLVRSEPHHSASVNSREVHHHCRRTRRRSLHHGVQLALQLCIGTHRKRGIHLGDLLGRARRDQVDDAHHRRASVAVIKLARGHSDLAHGDGVQLHVRTRFRIEQRLSPTCSRSRVPRQRSSDCICESVTTLACDTRLHGRHPEAEPRILRRSERARNFSSHRTKGGANHDIRHALQRPA